MDVALRFAYDGTAFEGYARQPDQHTVESALIAALVQEGFVEGSWRSGSRTDRGVSALENVAKARLDRPHLRGLVPAVQARLPNGLWITGAAQVAADWNPRFAAWREYHLLVAHQGEDLAEMRRAAGCFLGRHDMRAFARLDGRDPMREVSLFTIRKFGPGWRMRVRGPSFLWNQVRRMADAVLAVGAARADAADIQRALRTGTPYPGFGLAGAEGLLLARVAYRGLRWDPQAGLPAARDVARARTVTHQRTAVVEHVADLAGRGQRADR